MEFDHLTDLQLEAATDAARARAHNAPKSLEGSGSDAWARHSAEWMRLKNELERRKRRRQERAVNG
jgi:hypothetical protein